MHKAADIALAVVAVAAIMVIVRPGSQAAGVIQSLGGSFAGVISAATGGTSQRTVRRPRQKPRPNRPNR